MDPEQKLPNVTAELALYQGGKKRFESIPCNSPQWRRTGRMCCPCSFRFRFPS